MRGGISQVSGRYAKANNPFLEDYNPNEATSYLMYLDVNNLYGWAMMEALPLTNYEWCYDVDIDDILNTPDDSETGYILSVDVIYPKNLHDMHTDYPMCAEHRKPPGSKTKKLLLTLYDKNNYVLHYRTLKSIVKNGLKVKKVHKVLKFSQYPWLKPYIEFNTKQRTEAKNEFEKNLFKLMSNAVFGKSMENVRERVDIKLKNQWSGRYGASSLIAKPNFKTSTIFNEKLVAIELYKTEVFMNKPIIIGASILEISKLKMYSFHYDHMNKYFGDNCKILYTDTDSFIYYILTDNFYEHIKQNPSLFDTSDFAPNNVHNITLLNKKTPGLMKDENNGVCMSEFAGIRSKMYSIRVDRIDKVKKAKGIKKYVLKTKISFEDYLTCIKENCITTHNQNMILSKLHKVFTVRQSKVVLNPFDDKRFISDNNIDTLPWGHYSLNKNVN